MPIVLGLCILCGSLSAESLQPPAQYPCAPDEAVAMYLYAREALNAQPVTPDVDAPLPAQYAGKAIELRAKLRGRLVVNADDPARRQIRLRLELLNGSPMYASSPTEVKGLSDGDRVRVILEAVAERGQAPAFHVRAIVLEYDLPSERPLPVPEEPAPAATSKTVTVSAANSGLDLAIPPELRANPARTPTLAPFETRLPAMPRPDKAGAWDAVGNIGYPVIEPERLAPWMSFIARCNPQLSEAQRDWIARWVIYYSARNGVDHRLMFAMIKCESDFDPFCVSRAGAVGLTQLMPCNLEDFKVINKWNVQEQIRAGIEHFKEMLDMYKDRGNYEQFALAAASYNAGPNRVKREGGIPNITETRNYVKKLGDLFYKLWKEGYP